MVFASVSVGDGVAGVGVVSSSSVVAGDDINYLHGNLGSDNLII